KPITYGPNQYGFDYFYGLPASLDQPPFVYIENDRVLEPPTGVSGEVKLDRNGATMQTLWERGPIAPGYDHEQVLDDMNNKVLELIDRYSTDDKPFFIYYPTPAVHGPLLPNKKFKGSSGLNCYADVVLQVDDMVRQITEKLKEKGLYEDTVFIFTSDNGCSGVADYPFLLEHGHDPSAGYRAKKGSVYEGGHRVPTIVCWPSAIAAGTRSDALVCHSDFFKTFADIVGEDIPDNAAEDSISNLPLWTGKSTQVRDDAVFACSSGYLAIEKDGWKLECCENGGDTPKAMMSAFRQTPIEQNFELYHMDTDAGEKNNVIQENPDIVEALKAQLTRRLDEGRTSQGAVQPNFVPEGPWVQINWK
ncbi:MAG: sulfatase-like hydrolase/transferase, partial [Butyricicoccus sp.]